MHMKTTSHPKLTSLFDIRLTGVDHDVIVLKGDPGLAASALMSGKVVLSVLDSLTVKKLTLRLYATMRIKNPDAQQLKPGQRPMKFEKRLYEHVWDHFKIQEYLAEEGEGVQSLKRSPNHSSTSLKSLGNSIRSLSSNNLSSMYHSGLSRTNSSTNLKSNQVLRQGNYEFPFNAILPGDIPESVEGLPGGSVFYKLEAVIDRGKFHSHLIAKKHLRVVRTLTTDAVELSESVAVDNTWPSKVEYSLNVPSKAIAVGSSVPISLLLLPLTKGLKLGDIKIELVELYSCIGYLPPANNGDRVIASKLIRKTEEEDPDFMSDRWEIDTSLHVPDSLAKCTQDVDIETFIKVRHKLKFVICLINPDGHVSELRASLPIILFISPFISIRATNEADDTEVRSQQVEDGGEEELLFTAENVEPSEEENGNTALRSNKSNSSFNGIVAPPVYKNHIYDRLWSDVSPTESPIMSESSTPQYNRSSTNLNEQLQSELSMSPLDSVKLNEHLRNLSLRRQQEHGEPSMGSTPNSNSNRATFNIGESQGGETQGDYFTKGISIPLLSVDGCPAYYSRSPSAVTLPEHLSRTNSEAHFDTQTLSRVPSYNEAIKSNATEEVLSPAYEPPPKSSRTPLSAPDAAYMPGKPKLHHLGSTQSLKIGESSKVSPPLTRNVSMGSLTNLLGGNSRLPSRTANLSTSQFPLSSLYNLSKNSSSTNSLTKPSAIANDRSAAIGQSYSASNSTSGTQNSLFKRR